MFSTFFLKPDHPDPNNKTEPFSPGRFLSDWIFKIILPTALVTFTTTKSVTISLFSMMIMPCWAVYQGAYGMLHYRYHFGTPPYPQNPAHGVVVVSPDDLKEEKEVEYGNYNNSKCGNCNCEGGLRWRRGGALSKKEQAVLDNAMKQDPIRILVMGDSLALGLGTDRSCMPLLPETLAKSISKKMGGRAVFWTGYGGEGAASSWTLRELSAARRKQKLREMQQNASSSDLPSLEVELSDSGEDSTAEDDEKESFVKNNEDNNKVEQKPKKDGKHRDFSSSTKATNNKIDDVDAKERNKKLAKNFIKKNDSEEDMFSEWKEKLKEHREIFENDMAGPYDYVFIFAGGNDCKAAFIPFYGRTKKGDSSLLEDDGRTKSLLTDFERILECLSPKMNKNPSFNPNFTLLTKKEGSGDNSSNRMLTTTFSTKKDMSSILSPPLVVFPFMPPRIIPAFQHYPLLWLAVPLTNIIENNKRRLQRLYSKHVVTVESPTVKVVSEFEQQIGKIWKKRQTEDTLLLLRDVTPDECIRTIEAMKVHVETKKRIHKQYENRLPAASRDEVTICNAPQPKLSELVGCPSYNIFSVDRIHPNDEGYDFWARFIAEGMFQQMFHYNNDSNEDNNNEPRYNMTSEKLKKN